MADFNQQRLAQALMGPREGKLTPENEQGFQTFMAFNPNVRGWRNDWQNSFGEAPPPDSPVYDYRKAFMAEGGPRPPQPYSDNHYHWDSSGKSPEHPTAWMQDFMDQGWGDVNEAAQQGLTPPQSQMVNQNLSKDMFQGMVSNDDLIQPGISQNMLARLLMMGQR